jgi:hypothetical protein
MFIQEPPSEPREISSPPFAPQPQEDVIIML